MDVSIILVNYNTFELTCKCIESIIEKTTGITYEIILVDNGSQECDPALFETKFSGIHLIKSSRNLGFSKGNNLGIASSKGEIVLLLNSDTELVNNAVTLAYERIRLNPRIGVLTCMTIFPDGKLQPVSQPFKTLSAQISKLLRIYKLKKPRSFDLTQEHYTDWVWGSFFMILRKTITKFPNNKFQEDFFMYVEDIQWCYTIHKLGLQVLYYPEAVIVHHISKSAATPLSDWEKYVSKILPNEYKLFLLEKGKFYAILYYLTTAMLYFSWLNRPGLKKGQFYLKFVAKKILGIKGVSAVDKTLA